MKAETHFKIGSLDLEYLRGPAYNRPSVNERTIELPLAWWFSDKFPEATEIGCVTPYYSSSLHTVIDRCDSHPRAIPCDADSVNPQGKQILSISTFEHIGVAGEYGCKVDDPGKPERLLKTIIETATDWLITFPAGVHKPLQDFVRLNLVRWTIMERISSENEWRQNDALDLDHTAYGTPYPLANAIIIVTNRIEILNQK